MQALHSPSTGESVVWLKWGRVGDKPRASSSMWKGPLPDKKAAEKFFLKKYKEQTGNKFGAKPFVPKPKKYAPVEVVEKAPMATKTVAELTYKPSMLDTVTQELIENLLSKEMRDETLTSFDLEPTKLAVVAPILTNGLRIMPKLGGRVGAGIIFLASLQQYTSRPYSSPYACMFLVEAPLGKAYELKYDDTSLKKAPQGYDSVHAVGARQPKAWSDMDIDGRTVKVPQDSPEYLDDVESSFKDDEFLVHDKRQARLRYIVTIDM